MRMFIIVYEHRIGQGRVSRSTMTLLARNPEDAKLIFYRDNQHLGLPQVIRFNEVWSNLV